MSVPSTTYASDIATFGVAHTSASYSVMETSAGPRSIKMEKVGTSTSPNSVDGSPVHGDDTLTEEDMHMLRRVPGPIVWSAYTIAFCELVERFSYYGSSVLYTNFVQFPLPEGSKTGAGFSGQSGALGFGQKVSTSIGMFNSFFSHIVPLIGGYIADAHLGRYKTIHVSIAVSILAHVLLTIASVPSVITDTRGSFGAFIVGVICLGVGTGVLKANIPALIAEQNQDTTMRVEVRNGERVIVDPAVTNSRIFLYYYLAINIGSAAGQISMAWAEKRVGFWLAFLLPTVLFLVTPIVLFVCKKGYVLSPPTGSVLSKFFHMWIYAMKGKWFKPSSFTWDVARPSQVPTQQRPKWMVYDDAWIDEVRRGLKACKVFLFLPFYHLAYDQMTSNLTSQASSMQLHGVPNDIIRNLDPISIIILVPIIDHVLYPAFRKLGFRFTPIKRMTAGFFFGAAAMVSAAVTQHHIYLLSPCGEYPTSPHCAPAPINVWVQTIPYVLIGVSEIFTNVTSYEYAFSKAPDNMKSLVMAVNLFMSAFSAAIGQAFVPLSGDPLLVWNYSVVAILAFVGGSGFWICFRKLDKEEDKWNSIAKSEYRGKNFGGKAAEEVVRRDTSSAEKV
ncbi:peptide transporter PTR2 [Xylariaceae sp. FL0662B]|nr:peptide transporter PTR2 [Xylariaceae sp. FL0662B]